MAMVPNPIRTSERAGSVSKLAGFLMRLWLQLVGATNGGGLDANRRHPKFSDAAESNRERQSPTNPTRELNMTTSTGAPDIGNIFDADIVDPLKALLKDIEDAGESEAAALAQQASAVIASLESQGAQALQQGQAAIDAYVNPIVSTGVTAVVSAIPTIGPVIGKGAGVAATAITDAIIAGLITALSAGLSNAGKTQAANTLATAAGAS